MFGAHKTGKQSREGESKITAAIQYPEEFLQQFDEFSNRMTSDSRLMRVVGSLDSMDFKKVYVERQANQIRQVNPTRPWWYYAHKVKRVYRRRFPETFIPTKADLQ